jgi:hypothetical protein
VKKLPLIGLAVFALLVVAGIAAAGSLLDGSKSATARFHDVDKAIAAGYSFRLPEKPELGGRTCIVQPGQGAMGVHMVNVSLLDARLDAQEPEVLVYEPRNNGTLKLVALEYVVFKGAWEEAHGVGAAPPSMFGRTFDFTDEPNRYGLPPFYALHAWVWKPNPSGLLEPWNPRVECDGS